MVTRVTAKGQDVILTLLLLSGVNSIQIILVFGVFIPDSTDYMGRRSDVD